ncbi:helix-turn-helix domain-containing protein [Oceanobacillus luteolus]|uniref:Helix-turn-helix domain-containing protein n=1 Tax=Oceanobacillus luteolus TaxID=1274358 RepID=A0ABW4HKS5_9BACI|nr:helix-turn-helix domain-containing protein [Oceanobacillus luteolus]MCM3741503.1 helix-turn-helix domain-containing protein [Oceanobacillus luteolus]
MQRRTLSVNDVAEFLGLHRDTIYELVREDKIPHIRLGGRIFFLEDVLEDWLRKEMN